MCGGLFPEYGKVRDYRKFEKPKMIVVMSASIRTHTSKPLVILLKGFLYSKQDVCSFIALMLFLPNVFLPQLHTSISLPVSEQTGLILCILSI